MASRAKHRIWSDGTSEDGHPQTANAIYTMAFRAETPFEAKWLAARLNLAETAIDADPGGDLRHSDCLNDRPCPDCDFDEALDVAKRL